MSSTYSSNLRIELIGSGDQPGAWGSTTDSNFANIFDVAIAGYQAVTITSTSQLLTSLNGPTASAALNQSVYAMLKFNSASAATNVFAPPVSKSYIIWNNSGHAITIYNSAVINVIPSPITTTGVTIANGDKVMVWSDGTNFYELQAANLTGTLAISKGGTGQTTQQAAINALAGTQTNNRVLRSDGTNTTLSQVNVATDVTGTLAIANGGTGVTTITALGNLFYPVGSIYTSTSATSPASSLGFGTWVAFGAGRVVIGAGTGGGATYTGGATGGSKDAITVAHTHTFSATSGAMSANATHAHNIPHSTNGNWGSLNYGSYNNANAIQAGAATDSASVAHTHDVSGTTASTGASGTDANLQPYIVVYMWERTV